MGVGVGGGIVEESHVAGTSGGHWQLKCIDRGPGNKAAATGSDVCGDYLEFISSHSG